MGFAYTPAARGMLAEYRGIMYVKGHRLDVAIDEMVGGSTKTWVKGPVRELTSDPCVEERRKPGRRGKWAEFHYHDARPADFDEAVNALELHVEQLLS
jgi:hypothetical protein